jgi:threonine dehydratase
MIGIQDIERAALRLQGQLLATPCVESRTLSDIVGAQVFLKFENLQFTASFKERGACNKLVDLAEAGVRGVAQIALDRVAGGATPRETFSRNDVGEVVVPQQ